MTRYTDTSAPKKKPIHRADKCTEDGRVSALCSDPPRAINLRRASWTLRDEAVTCKRCIALLTEARP